MITFVPQRGQILICDFDMAGVVPPEMRKKRRIVVVSPRSHNHRHGQRPGRCLVVPFSASTPAVLTAAEVSFPGDAYRSLTVPTWAICSSVESVSHARLDRVAVGTTFLSEHLSDADMLRVDDGLRHAALPDRVAMGIFEFYPARDLRGSIMTASCRALNEAAGAIRRPSCACVPPSASSAR